MNGVMEFVRVHIEAFMYRHIDSSLVSLSYSCWIKRTQHGILMTYFISISTPSHFVTLFEVCLSLTLCISALEEHMFSLASCHIADTSCDPWADVLSGAARPSGFRTQVCRFCLPCPLNAPFHSVPAAVFRPGRGQPSFTSPPHGAARSLGSMGDHNLQEIKAHTITNTSLGFC